MNFETEYKNLNFHITLEKVEVTDVTLLLGDKFNRIANKTLIELKKGNLVPFNLVVKSKNALSNPDEERTHYWSNVLLTSDAEELLEELGHYLDDEEILDSIVKNWELAGDENGPAWK
ncbi:MAG: hypothetical protein EHM20_10400 [Alphaproteobacteria bacterium]|nr:MAG: hypothetical protein EHM20_10400 [Alphaproteobacteria bacterium]